MTMAQMWIFLLLPALVASDCPIGWTGFAEKCYYFSKRTETWTAASTFCQSFSSKLAEPQNTDELGFLTEKISHSAIVDHWVGITDLIVENHWVYDSSSTPIRNNNWGPHEPNGHLAENCVVMSQGYHGKYADVDCHTARGFICEKESLVGTAVIGQMLGRRRVFLTML